MSSEELKSVVDVLGERLEERIINIKVKEGIFINSLNQKGEAFEQFKKLIRKRWEQFNSKNRNNIIKKSYSTFFYNNLPYFFENILETFFGLDPKKSLKMNSKEKISSRELIISYQYTLSNEEEQIFAELTKKLHQKKIYDLESPTLYFYFITSILGKLLRRELQQQFRITLEGGILRNNHIHRKLDFLIVVRHSKDEIYNYYYKMLSYYFFRHYNELPETFFEGLLESRERLFEIAEKEYKKPDIREKLVNLLYYFYRKCSILQNFCPMLDFLNFVCSRVEDSTFSKIEIIKNNYLANFSYSVEKKESLLDVFKFLDRWSTLSSTFLANNLPSPQSQLNLFLLYKKYYFGSGLESLEVGDILFHPTIFRDRLNEKNKSLEYDINANSIKYINSFLDNFSTLSKSESINQIFKKILKKKISDLNYEFFTSFYRSLNEKTHSLIEKQNLKISKIDPNENVGYDYFIDHICRMLYVLIDKIFLCENPEDASKNFIDPRGRYIGRNIALRVLELFIFQDINFSDDLWPDFILSWNKENLMEKIKPYNIKLSKKDFYDGNELTRFLLTYSFQSVSYHLYLEEWLIEDVIIPINNFIMSIKNSIKDITEEIEVSNYLCQILLKDLEKPDSIEEIKVFCKNIADFWRAF
ncbi:MAG: hypothetical protein GF317_02730 [Candidatus Lokiarchaeota archaeon]|nr:hypothetical protein [Candidatus Lokiarchaeota archaeon]MBD3198822.1 hypothetical protein [Candidatus Lokiarchaeota archaeon]